MSQSVQFDIYVGPADANEPPSKWNTSSSNLICAKKNKK